MNIKKILDDIFLSSEEKHKKEIEKEREEVKKRFAKQLKEQCYLNDAEIAQVLEVIDKNYKIMDEVLNNVEYDETKPKDFALSFQMSDLRRNLMQETKDKINELLKLKLARAKKVFGIEE